MVRMSSCPRRRSRFVPLATRSAAPFVVTADPNVAVVDPSSGRHPGPAAERARSRQGTFTATGIDAHDMRADGSVQFKSENTVDARVDSRQDTDRLHAATASTS